MSCRGDLSTKIVSFTWPSCLFCHPKGFAHICGSQTCKSTFPRTSQCSLKGCSHHVRVAPNIMDDWCLGHPKDAQPRYQGIWTVFHLSNCICYMGFSSQEAPLCHFGTSVAILGHVASKSFGSFRTMGCFSCTVWFDNHLGLYFTCGLKKESSAHCPVLLL